MPPMRSVTGSSPRWCKGYGMWKRRWDLATSAFRMLRFRISNTAVGRLDCGVPRPYFTADDLAFQAAVAIGALDNLSTNIRNVDVRELFAVVEALERFRDALKVRGST